MKTNRRALMAFSFVTAAICSGGVLAAGSAPILSLSEAEHISGDLRQGMTADEVQKLLGRPRRTALKNDGAPSSASSKGTLQWTYTWANASGPGSLRVEFASKSPDEWTVNSWEWVGY
jgi:hypothetical protein